jgi:Domain of unknown function (DUF4062)
MASSTVYGIESLLDAIYGALNGIGYKVWMSHKGSVPVHPRRSNFYNGLQAVRDCDLFLGIITGRYGSGRSPGELSITHREIQQAIALDKLRWFLAHRDVVTARQVLRQFQEKSGGWKQGFSLAKNPVLDDIRIIDMYEEAIRQDLPLGHRTDNWVQPFLQPKEALQFVEEQFGDIQRIKQLLQEDVA